MLDVTPLHRPSDPMGRLFVARVEFVRAPNIIERRGKKLLRVFRQVGTDRVWQVLGRGRALRREESVCQAMMSGVKASSNCFTLSRSSSLRFFSRCT